MIMHDKFARLMEPFFTDDLSTKIAVAVSGGADSLSLLCLTAEWARDKHQVIAITVDHGLRPEAAQEAEYVAQVCQQLGVEHVILHWQGDKPSAAIQESARQARYALMFDWCYAHGCSTLMTAHHAEDNWETHMQRLAKGSGPTGLSGITSVTYHKFGRLLRPLLEVSRSELQEVAQQAGLSPVMDPSNVNTDFSRVRWRQLYDSLASLGLDAKAVYASQARVRQADQYINARVRQFLARYVRVHEAGYITLRSMKAETIILQRVFSALTYFLSQSEYVPPLASVDYALAELSMGRAASVANCIVVSLDDGVIVSRDIRTLDTVNIAPDTSITWSGLYQVTNNSTDVITAKPLGKRGVQLLQSSGWIQRESDLPRSVHESLLALWCGHKLLSVPHLLREVDMEHIARVDFIPKRSL